MKLVIITHVNHIQNDNQYFGYAPYVREMNIWLKYVDEVIVVGPLLKGNLTAIDISYNHPRINFRKTPNFNLTTFKNSIFSVFKFPIIIWRIFWAMKDADHIHLRCPGNIGLLGCIVQILFPNKIKTAKYAGNWDQKSKQPWTYRLQKWILSNTFLNRNMQVLVYGHWENQSKNIKPFFTATYPESEKEIFKKAGFEETIEFVFVGSLVPGKKPIYAVKLLEQLIKKGHNLVLNLYGEGVERSALEQYIQENQLGKNIILHGNQDIETIKKAYRKSHFVLLPSKSEGWPKAVAEAMFWGCVPVATKVSCVPFMLDNGNRGVLLDMNLDKDVADMEEILTNEAVFFTKSKSAIEWSQKYTTDVFESEIKKLLGK
ncbi:glycosyltransferase family 4 protein [Flavobacterium sp. MMLR14_040]|uniref:glycosyltransferase family 4 protein n=1 Tax=Flavobacterium sp. MMLR14_040 TaxID=3093843 RepID=UPI00298FE08F|nr:glycosyltransferase family 4 protein [Flavobacterium sp. MMLR14_040]MDW8849227.1 glycosyltransferase family 4 protein [Flavobacterium sp. MMLR14_040]